MVPKTTVTKDVPYHHREDAERLTTDICNEYRKKAISVGINNVSTIHALQQELQQKCDITQLLLRLIFVLVLVCLPSWKLRAETALILGVED